MTRTNYTIDDIGGALSWGSAYAFIKNLGTDSALSREISNTGSWSNTLQTNSILADIYDLLQVIHADLVMWSSQGKKKAKTKPYPRPGQDNDKDKRRYGKGAMPLNELREWMRRRTHG